jgi:hypothetical protein
VPKRRRGGYHGGGTVIRASVGLLRERTEKKNAKVQRERERFAAEQAAFAESQTATLIKAESPEGRKRLLKNRAVQRGGEKIHCSNPASARAWRTSGEQRTSREASDAHASDPHPTSPTAAYSNGTRNVRDRNLIRQFTADTQRIGVIQFDAQARRIRADSTIGGR